MCAYSGLKSGRSPKDKRIVLDKTTEKDIWWGSVNIPISPNTYKIVESRAVDYMSSRPRIYVQDGYAGWDPENRLKIRVISVRPYHALFMRNMLIVPTKEELEKDFTDDKIDYHIFNAGEHPNCKHYEGTGTKTCVSLNFTEKKITILGSQYAGEMKKGVFSVMNYLMPKKGILSMHASANEGKKGDVSILFGLSGTGKTTLSADPHRRLIGDDEHCWSDKGVFNIEGGCYAKCINLSKEKEPELFNAVKFGTVLENVDFADIHSHEVNWDSSKITENTRACYPLEFINDVKIPAIGGHPKNIFFLTCDAFGVIPPVSKLCPDQAMYHFVSGYTAKVAGTEVGITEPTTTFSSCFGEAFLPLHPFAYAELLAKKIKQHNTNVWLINTGWSGGKHGVGKRMDLKITRRIIDSIHNGELDNVNFHSSPVFNFAIPDNVQGVPKDILDPEKTWKNKDEFNRTLNGLGISFKENMKKYQDKMPKSVADNGGPRL
jgi:phosphoenolpyruvate carboxykinase (ATP)